MSDSRFGVAFPTGMEGLMYPVPFSDTDNLVELAVEAESLGFDSIGGNDHIITQDYVKAEWDTDPRYYDVFNTFSYVAAKTSEIELNTAVTVLPLRDPVWVAKQAITLDQFSDGRVVLGTGVGAYREEFDAVHPDVSLSRGRIMDESVEALAQLFTPGAASYDGEFVAYEDVDLHPKPVQEPFPLYVGGNHPNAMKRAVRHGQGWLPAGLTPDEVEARLEDLDELCAEYDRDPDEIDVAPQLIAAVDRDGDRARESFRESQVFEHLKSLSGSTLKDQSLDDLVEQNLIGSPDELIESLQRYHDLGVDHFPAIIFAANDVEELHEQLSVFADTVMPSFE
ncbi:TIGR03619 family F420-dependent LLM class oxidoreductase [Halovivax cerinus]|uniref:TIGR03619 family F420-dependent LLM class oxidoreductase n=1 Tax=Halovivax cerinus TaxID=1487865 RepID=A0ABD5NRB9_9EURY|nr:TIGR03619 family F420-dependent LLM class oxidoreductase [Halovivax cerinus]